MAADDIIEQRQRGKKVLRTTLWLSLNMDYRKMLLQTKIITLNLSFAHDYMVIKSSGSRQRAEPSYSILHEQQQMRYET